MGAMRSFVERHGLGFAPHAVDPDGDLWARLGVRAQPTWIFVDGGGTATTEFGDLEGGALRARLDDLLAR